MPGIDPPPAWVGACGGKDRIDRLQIASFQPPGLNMTEAGHRPYGSEGEYKTFGRIVHWLTPETATSTHYFFSFGRNYDLKDRALTEAIRSGTFSTFTEDRFVLELQQKALIERGDDRVPNMAIALDGAAVQGRRVLAAAIARESEDPHTVLAPFPINPALR
jgi:hypothetical protein